jgi:hypothetical protein
LLIHWITCKLSGKPIFEPSEKQEFENLWVIVNWSPVVSLGPFQKQFENKKLV